MAFIQPLGLAFALLSFQSMYWTFLLYKDNTPFAQYMHTANINLGHSRRLAVRIFCHGLLPRLVLTKSPSHHIIHSLYGFVVHFLEPLSPGLPRAVSRLCVNFGSQESVQSLKGRRKKNMKKHGKSKNLPGTFAHQSHQSFPFFFGYRGPLFGVGWLMGSGQDWLATTLAIQWVIRECCRIQCTC